MRQALIFVSRAKPNFGSQQLRLFFPSDFSKAAMDDLDALLDLEGAAFGDDDEGVFEDDDVGGGGPSTKAGEEDGRRETVKAIGDARRRRPNDKNSSSSLNSRNSHSLSC